MSVDHPQFRSVSTTSNLSLNSSSTSITRVASAPLNHSFNKQSVAADHLYHQCVVLKRRLESIEGMAPFMNLAFNAAEQCAEQQALALSQQMQQESHRIEEMESGFGGTSGFGLHGGSSGAGFKQRNHIFTFTAGVLPANISVDPATQLWKLFQQGAPLCLIFNSICPQHQLTVIGSDDMRVCKKSVYEFLIAVKTHLALEDEYMFTISNVFSDDTADLVRIIKVVTKLLSLSSVDALADAMAEVSIGDDRSKVFREIIDTERKYVQDLELLARYRDELVEAQLLSSEQIHILFPNLNEVIDFQRRFLMGLECNISVPHKYQRIGSVFLHAASGPFKSYEPWTIGQLAALDLISKEAGNMRKSSQVLDPGFELQSFLLKPIQRLCKYPLLLRELVKAQPAENPMPASHNELALAHTAMKELANDVNEAQRRAENVEYLHKLVARVADWKGFNLHDQGELLYHGIVGVRDAENEKEYVAYLFEKIIFFFTEADPRDRKKNLLGNRKKSTSSNSSSSVNLVDAVSEKSPLVLKGRVYISEVYNISSTNTAQGYTLVISWSGKKESGSFTLRYRTEEIRNQWEQCLRSLKTSEMNLSIHRRMRDSHGSQTTADSYDVAAAYSNFSPTTPHTDSQSLRSSNGSSYFNRHQSSSSTFSMMKSAKKHSESSRSSANGTITSYNPETSYSSTASAHGIKIKLIYSRIDLPDPLLVSPDIQFNELYSKISGMIANSDQVTDDILVNKLKYKDEDGDFVVMDSNDDWNLAVDMLEELGAVDGDYYDLTIWVS
ncbi:cell division control protein 24 [Diutina catenulata]